MTKLINRNNSIKIVVAAVLFIGAIGGLYYYTRNNTVTPEQIISVTEHPYNSTVTPPNTTSNNVATEVLATEYALNVPFSPQAPTANWDELHNEACEEASAIMVHAYFSGDTRAIIPADEMEQEVTKLTNWQQQQFGYYLDTTAEETATMIHEVYKLNAKVVPALSENNLKREIANGNLVIIPANGQLLKNPYFKQPGPIYHMVVVKGFTKNKIITNDPGTKRGANYGYDFATLSAAGANWDHGLHTIDSAQKVMIVISK